MTLCRYPRLLSNIEAGHGTFFTNWQRYHEHGVRKWKQHALFWRLKLFVLFATLVTFFLLIHKYIIFFIYLFFAKNLNEKVSPDWLLTDRQTRIKQQKDTHVINYWVRLFWCLLHCRPNLEIWFRSFIKCIDIDTFRKIRKNINIIIWT